MKIILSRKGFDTAAGGYPSPHFIGDGRLLSLPIPEGIGKSDVPAANTYSQLRFNEKASYLDIMRNLGIKRFEDKYAHREVENVDPDKHYEEWKQAHPHYYYRKREQNTVYVASEKLSFFRNLPGYGVFNYKDPLVLTAPNQNNRSTWRLPKYFHPIFGTRMSYHETCTNKRVWGLHDNYCILFVFPYDCSISGITAV